MIIFGSILTTFELSSIFGGSWGSIKNWLELKIKPPLGNLVCLNLRNALYHKTVISFNCGKDLSNLYIETFSFSLLPFKTGESSSLSCNFLSHKTAE